MTIVTGNLRTLINTAPTVGRVWFRLSRPNWDAGTGHIFAPETVEAVGHPTTGTFSADLTPTAIMEEDAVYYAVLKYRDPATGTNKEHSLGSFALPNVPGPLELADILVSGPFAPVPADILALVLAAQSATETAATNAELAADEAGLSAQINFQTYAAALAFVAGGGTFTAGRLYSIAGVLYVGRASATYVPGLPGLAPIYPGLAPRNNTGHLVALLAGQSWAVGADSFTTGATWAVNSKVQVWSPNGSAAWGAPVQSQAPFNVNGSVNEGIEFLNRMAEETPLNMRLYLNAAGGISIAEWVGTPANRTISVGNRPKWVELTAMIAAGVSLPDIFIWHQGVADHAAMSVDYYRSEFAYLLSQLTGAGIITQNTPVLVVEAPNGIDRSDNGLSQNSYRTNNMLHGLRLLDDPRIHLVGTFGVPAPYETVNVSDTFSSHFSDAGVRIIGRERIYGTAISAWAGAVQGPMDPGIARSLTKEGFVGSHLRRSQLVTSGTYTVLMEDMNGVIEAAAGTTIALPNFADTTPFTTAVQAGQGVGFTFIPRGAGTYTFTVSAPSNIAGTGPINSGTSNSFTFTAGNNDVWVPVYIRWTNGTTWRITPVGHIGPRVLRWTPTIDLPSVAAGATVTATVAAVGATLGMPIAFGTPNAWQTVGVQVQYAWVSAADVISFTAINTSGATQNPGNLGVIVVGFV